MKFHKSTKFIINFDWYKKYRLGRKNRTPNFITCNQLFIEGKSIEECENYFFLKIKSKDTKYIKIVKIMKT